MSEYQPRTAGRLIEILRARDAGPRSWQTEAADTIASLTEEVERAKACCDSYADENQRLHDRAEAAEATIERLETALKPFAEAADSLNDDHRDCSDIWESPAAMCITAGNLRAARAALQSTEQRT